MPHVRVAPVPGLPGAVRRGRAPLQVQLDRTLAPSRLPFSGFYLR